MQGVHIEMEWGRDGAKRAAERGDILVVVDVLRFSTAVAAAVSRGALVAPCAWEDDPFALAEKFGAEVATSHRDAPRPSRFSLSPLSYENIEPGTRIVLPSPNGATCSRLGANVPYLFAGAFVNAKAVAYTIHRILLHKPPLNVSVIACGERWKEPGEDGPLRFAIEDYLGAGSIIKQLCTSDEWIGGFSGEAIACMFGYEGIVCKYEGTAGGISGLFLNCYSGIELFQRKEWKDVEFASQQNIISVAPVLRDGWFLPWQDAFLP